MISKIKEYECALRNYAYSEIVDYPKYIKQTNNYVQIAMRTQRMEYSQVSREGQ